MSRKYLPTLSELIDRLSIAQLKEVFIQEHKEEYAQEIKDIMHDINLEGIDAEMIRAVIVFECFSNNPFTRIIIKIIRGYYIRNLL